MSVNLKGFWNYDQISPHVLDVCNVLSVKFPYNNFLLLLEQSSGHAKMREGELSANTISVRWGSKQEMSRVMKFKEVSPYSRKLNVGVKQVIVSREMDDGPFY